MRLFWSVLWFSLPALAGVHGEATRRQPTAEAALLSDAELFYQVSGGFAGVVRTARVFAESGEARAEYASDEGRSVVTPQSAPLERARYLKLWQDAERAGIWSVEISGKTKGADEMVHELRVRAGNRRHSVSWTDGNASSPAAQNALRIGESILALAREVTTER